MMTAALLSRAEVALRGEALYERAMRGQIENEDNIGRMVIIDIESGDYAAEGLGVMERTVA